VTLIERSSWVVVAAGVLLGCGGDSTGPQSSTLSLALNCAGTGPTQLVPGAHVVLDPAAAGGCLVLPAAGPAVTIPFSKGTGAVVTPMVVPRFGVARVR
jgi:hypothetical protein